MSVGRSLEQRSGYGSEVHQHKHDRTGIVAKAIVILDSYGIADLTMRRLARELDVSPGALYWHFANKQELLGAVADEVLAPARVTAPDAEWPARIATVSRRLRDALLSHTDGAELVSASLAAGQSAALRSILDLLSDAAVAAGVVQAEAELAARTTVYYVLGFTADEQSRLQWDASGALPESQSLLNDAARQGDTFDFGLSLLIDGLSVKAAQTFDRSRQYR
jgi:TetR/AcrR family transcriptional regulator, tetracycline repressor protein